MQRKYSKSHKKLNYEDVLWEYQRSILGTVTLYDNNNNNTDSNNNKIIKTANSEEREDSDSQSYHTVRFKCSVFNKKL